jgi:hypothetical protein
MSRDEAEPQLKNISTYRKAIGFPQCAAAEPPKAGAVALSDRDQRRLAVGVTQGEIEFGFDITEAAL